MLSHTPGPWRIGNLESYDGYTGKPYRNVWAGVDDAATVVARAIHDGGAETNDVDKDARLIAAAPELLAALRKVVAECTNDAPCIPAIDAAMDDASALLARLDK